MKKFPQFIQLGQKDCGPSSLKIILAYYKKNVPIAVIRDLCETTRRGSNLFFLSKAAEKLGFTTMVVKTTLKDLQEDMPLPCILHWQKKHYAVLYKIKKNKYYISDPAYGLITYSELEFKQNWISDIDEEGNKIGISMILQPQMTFEDIEYEEQKHPSIKRASLYKFYIRYRKLITQILIGFVITSFIQFILPFFTQNLIDIGIQKQNVGFIYLILFSQLFFLFGLNSVEVLRRWILLHLNTRINISLLTEFFIKLMKLPMSFFDTRITGDLLQRLKDHAIVNKFLTDSSFDALFSSFNIIIFSTILAIYDTSLFFIFIIMSVISVFWVFLFLKKRKELNYKQFSKLSEEQAKELEVITGMPEIKQNNAELQIRWEWERLQAKLFKIDIKKLALQQYQENGAKFISDIRDVILVLYAAKLTLNGSITLGMLITIQYIVGQLSSFITMLINFINSAQDAIISFDRIMEIHSLPNEQISNEQVEIKPFESIKISNLSFRYQSTLNPVLKNINLEIPINKHTAIVGLVVVEKQHCLNYY